MIKLEHNQRVLYQWSLNKRVIVDGFLSGTKVEWSVRYDSKDSALTTVAYAEGDHIYADIPNILLQSPGYIRALVIPSAADMEHMPEEIDIKVVRREKPEDYIYTETPTLTLDNKIDKYWGEENKGKALVIGDDGCVTAGVAAGSGSAGVYVGAEEPTDPNALVWIDPDDGGTTEDGGVTVDTDAVAEAVEEYLAEHPPTVNETDPTVPDWAKQPEKPTYTADEVGALSEDTKIPATAADVGAIPAPATAKVGQTIVVTEVDDDGKPVKWECVDVGGSGEEKPFASVVMTGKTYPVLAYADNVITIEPTDLDGEYVIIRTANHSGGLTIKLVATDTPGQYTIYNLDGGVGIGSNTSVIPDISTCVIEVRDADNLKITGLSGFEYLKIRVTAPLCVAHGLRNTYVLRNYPDPTRFSFTHYYIGKAFEGIVETKAYDVIEGKMWITWACASKSSSKPNIYNDFSDHVDVPDTLTLEHYTNGMTIGTKLEVWGR